MDYSLHYDDELTITATFSPNVTPEMAFEFLEFFKTNARLDPLTKRLSLSYHFENGNGYGCGHDISLDRHQHLCCVQVTTFVGSFDRTPIPAFYPSAIDTIMSMFKQISLVS